jgi:hypothetical protein
MTSVAGNLRPSGPAGSDQHQFYSTDSLHFAAWLICDNLLPYASCAKVGRKIWFFFQDTDNRGPALNAQWQSSNPLVPQKTINEVVRMLRTEMTAVQNGSEVMR